MAIKINAKMNLYADCAVLILSFIALSAVIIASLAEYSIHGSVKETAISLVVTLLIVVFTIPQSIKSIVYYFRNKQHIN